MFPYIYIVLNVCISQDQLIPFFLFQPNHYEQINTIIKQQCLNYNPSIVNISLFELTRRLKVVLDGNVRTLLFLKPIRVSNRRG